MAAASYYDAPGGMQAQPHFPPTNTHVEGYGQSPGLGQETPSEQRGYPQQTYNGQNSASYGGHGQQMMGQQETEHQHMGQNQMGFGNDPQGALEPQMNGGGIQQAAQPDNRDTLTKWLDKVERKFGGERFSNPANAEKNKALNANILKRLKQVGKLVMQRGPGMLMRVVR